MTKYTLITGASTGLGVQFAHLAARENRNMILTARSKDKLDALAEEIRAQGLDVIVIPADLGDVAEADRLWTEATADGREIDVLVNNAGLGSNGDFADAATWERELASIQVNLVSLTRLMKLAIPHMSGLEKARILNVASAAGFMPGPNMAVYHATKAFVLHLSEAVATELEGTPVTVTALCPGVTATEFFEAADMKSMRALQFGKPMKAFDVAEEGWLEARIGRRVVVPGIMNKIFALLPRLLPRRWSAGIAKMFLQKT